MHLIRTALCAWLLTAVCAPALAQYPLEVVTLKHRTVEQVLPVLRPLLEPGGEIFGQFGYLAVRTSPGNLRELQRALESIDRPARRLQILVRYDDSAQHESRSARIGARAGEGGASVDVRAHDSRGAAQERVDQRLQVMEGARAYVATGRAPTLPQRQPIQAPSGVLSQQTYAVQEISTGFEVVPRLVGDQVHLEIAQERATPGAAPGSVQAQRMATTVTTRLGEWVELAAVGTEMASEHRGAGAIGRTSAVESRRVWVKVEAAP